MMNEQSVHLTSLPFGFAPVASDIHVCWSFGCSGTGRQYSNRKETSCLPLLNAGFDPGSLMTPIPQQTDCPLTNRLSYQVSSL